jgi:hypothetical protein
MSFRRIVVAMGAPGGIAMTTAVDLARALEAELVGLFVEDAELFDLAALPFAGEVGFPSAARRALDVEALERALRAQAGRLRQELTVRLAGVPTKWTFEVVRGRIAVELAATAGGEDLVVLPLPLAARGRRVPRGEVARAFGRLRAPLLLVDEAHRHRRAIGVVAPTHTEPGAIADVLRGLAPFDGRCVQLVAIGRVADWDAWQARMRGLLDAVGASGGFRSTASADPDELRRLLGDEARGVIVVLVDEPQARDAVIDAATIPLLLLPVSVPE